MIQVMYAIAFFAALRVGETTCQTNPIQLKGNGDNIDAIKLTLRNYKHCNTAESVDIFVYFFLSIWEGRNPKSSNLIG